jgi:hypothetical protein
MKMWKLVKDVVPLANTRVISFVCLVINLIREFLKCVLNMVLKSLK